MVISRLSSLLWPTIPRRISRSKTSWFVNAYYISSISNLSNNSAWPTNVSPDNRARKYASSLQPITFILLVHSFWIARLAVDMFWMCIPIFFCLLVVHSKPLYTYSDKDLVNEINLHDQRGLHHSNTYMLHLSNQIKST